MKENKEIFSSSQESEKTSKNSSDSSVKSPYKSLLSLSINALKITVTLTIIKTIIDFGTQVALARWLSPEIFGIIAIAIAMSGFFSIISDLNAQRWIIRKKEISKEEISTVFTFELSFSIIVSAVWYFIAPIILINLDKANVIPYAKILSIWIITERLQTPKAIFERDLNFKTTNLALFFGVLIGSVVTLLLVYFNFGGFSIIYGMIAKSISIALILWIKSPITPLLKFNPDIARNLITFGFPVTISSAMVYFYSNIDYIIVGKILGETALGYYFIAYKFPHYIHQLQMLISSVAFPAFSRTKDDEHLTRGFNLATKYSAMFSLPILLTTIIFGKEIIIFLLGEKWLPALFPFKLFMFLAAIRIITVYWYEVYVSKGLTKSIPILTLINSIGVPIFAIIGAKFWGIEGAAVGVSISILITIFIATEFYLKKVLKVSYLKILANPIKINFIFLIILGITKIIFPTIKSSYAFWIIIAFFTAGYCSVLYLIDREEIKKLINQISSANLNLSSER